MSSDQVKQIISQMSGALGANSGLGGTLKFDFGEPGSVYIDGKSSPNTVADGDGKSADCTISVSLETFEKMVKGELDGTSANYGGLSPSSTVNQIFGPETSQAAEVAGLQLTNRCSR